jgi:hypothetical protein
MKLFIATLLTFGVLSTAYAAEPAKAASAPETKKVCIDKVKDGKPVLDKAGRVQQDCKEVKQHKKLEGTKVEDAKKDTAKK